jgi:hypothetical protein
MNTTAGAHENEWSLRRFTSGTVFQSLGAAGVVVLAIVGLAGIDSNTLAAIATILTGAFFLYEGGSLIPGYRRMASEGQGERSMGEGGMTAEFMAGVAGIVLGILGLFGIYPTILLPAAVIVFGAALLLTGVTASRLQWLLGTPGRPSQEHLGEVVMEVASLSGNYFFVGVGALVLGILGVIGLSSIVLTLVGLLSLGVAGLLSGASFTGRPGWAQT